MQLVELGQQLRVGRGVVALKARHRALASAQLATRLVLGHQPSQRLARIAADTLQIAQNHTALDPTEGAVVEPP